MPLNPTGSRPTISIKFDQRIPPGKAESGTCTLLIRKAPTTQWSEIATIHNRPISSHVIDPSIHSGSGISVADSIGAEIRYNVLFLDIDGDDKIDCSFDLEILQDGAIIIEKNEEASENNVQFIAFSQTFTLS
jgi:hypothetical protein